MKILHVIGSTDPARGGPLEAIKQAYWAAASLGHRIDVASTDAPDSEWLPQLPFDVAALGPGGMKYGYSAKYRPWLRDNAKNYDCLIMNSIWLYACAGAWLELRNSDLPFFVYTHGLLDPAFKKLFPVKHTKKLIYWKLLLHRVLRDAKAVLFTCESEMLLAQGAFRPFSCNGAIVPYCVGPPPEDIDNQRTAFRHRFPELEGKRLILFLSRIHEKKGCDLLIRAFAKVASTDASLHLVMAGPGEAKWMRHLQKLARDRGVAEKITWTGMLSGELKWGAFRSAEVFVLPSHQENFGIAIVEALACGLPVLITNKVNIWREIEMDGAGLVADDDQQGADELLKNWLSLAGQQKEEMKSASLECFNSRFRSQNAARTLIRTLRENGVQG